MKNSRKTGENTETIEGTKMNSPELQKHFYSWYKEFFNMHNLVLSAPAILTWGADISHGVSVLRIKQKLPLKTFCGIRFNTSGKVTFGKITHYSALTRAFQEDEFEVLFKNDSEKILFFLQDFLSKEEGVRGMEIDFLTEAPRGHGFSFTGVISVLLTYVMYIISGKIDTPLPEDRTFPSPTSPLFEELYQSGLALLKCISHGKNFGGSSNYAVMVPDAPLPIVYLSENKPDDSGRDTILYKNTLLDFLSLEPTYAQELPLDYGVIFTGMEYVFGDTESTRESNKRDNDGLDDFVNRIKDKLSSIDGTGESWSHVFDFDKGDIARKGMDLTNLRILQGFDALLKNTYNDDAVNAFIATIKNTGLMSFSYQKENKFFFALQYLFSIYRQFEDEEIGVLPFNTGKIGGSLFFVLKHEKSRSTMQKVLHHLSSEGYSATLEHASWRDGYAREGVRLEQYVSHQCYSDYTKEHDALFSDSSGRSYSANYDTIVKQEKHNILLDAIQGRIYIRGIKLTSKDIHSQNTTIDMLRILLRHLGQEVANTELPVSTYSQNKSEILGKVIMPIRKLTKEHFGQELSVFCSGGIGTYYLRLERDPGMNIGIIERL